MNNVESIKALLDAGAEVEVVDMCGDTPLALARKFNKPEAVNLLQAATRQQRNGIGTTSGGGATNGAIAASDKGRVGIRAVDNRRKMKLHLESGTGLFEQNPPPLSPPSNRVATRSPPPPVNSMAAMSAVNRITAAAGATPSSSTIGKRGGAPPAPAGGARREPEPELDSPPQRGSGDMDKEGSTSTTWKKKEWSEAGPSVPASGAHMAGARGAERNRGKTELLSSGGTLIAGPQGPDGWKKMKSFFSTSAHPLPSQPAVPVTIEALQSQLQLELSERRRMEEELRKFKQRAGPLMYQLKRRYVECYDANKTLALRNEHLEREVETLKVGQVGQTTTSKPTLPPREKPREVHAEIEDLKSPRRPDEKDFMARERMLEAKEKKEWRNTRMMMVESIKVEKLELMAQVEELKEKLKGLTKDMLEVLDENEKLVKQLEIAEDERDKCIKLLEGKIS